jgi:hypothetical protein
MVAIAFFGLRVAAREVLAVGAVMVIVVAIAWHAATRRSLTRSIGVWILRLQAIRERVGEKQLRVLGQIALAAWFAGLTYMRIARFVRDQVLLGQDIRIYYRGVEQWLHGGDPWAGELAVRHSLFQRPEAADKAPARRLVSAPRAGLRML